MTKRSEDEIRKKLKDVRFKYLTAEYKKALKVTPSNCVHNYRHKTLDESGKNVTVGLCTLGMENPEEWNGKICDDDSTAQECPFFLSCVSKQSVKEDFDIKLQDETEVATSYKDVAALQWVLGEKVYSWDLTFLERFYIFAWMLLYKSQMFLRQKRIK